MFASIFYWNISFYNLAMGTWFIVTEVQFSLICSTETQYLIYYFRWWKLNIKIKLSYHQSSHCLWSLREQSVVSSIQHNWSEKQLYIAKLLLSFHNLATPKKLLWEILDSGFGSIDQLDLLCLGQKQFPKKVWTKSKWGSTT